EIGIAGYTAELGRFVLERGAPEEQEARTRGASQLDERGGGDASGAARHHKHRPRLDTTARRRRRCRDAGEGHARAVLGESDFFLDPSVEQLRDEGGGEGAVVSAAALEVDGPHRGERPFLSGGFGQRAEATEPGPHAARTREAEVAPGILHRDECAALRGE